MGKIQILLVYFIQGHFSYDLFLPLCFCFYITLSLQICILSFLITTHFCNKMALAVFLLPSCLFSMFFWKKNKKWTKWVTMEMSHVLLLTGLIHFPYCPRGQTFPRYLWPKYRSATCQGNQTAVGTILAPNDASPLFHGIKKTKQNKTQNPKVIHNRRVYIFGVL